MELYQIILIFALVALPILLILAIIMFTQKSRKALRNSQENVTDKELIEFINSQPDKIIDSKLLMEEFDLTKFEANGRLRHFFHYGLLNVLRSSGGIKSYYTLSRPIDQSYDLNLTEDPFMTVEDLMMIFKHFDYQVTLQELCLATGLPIKVLVEEMKYFQKEHIVNCLLQSNVGAFNHQRIYSLKEPYRSNPEEYMGLKEANFELSEIYKQVRKA